MSNTWTPEQLKILDAIGNTLVYASAGSGKTAVMVEKIIRKLKEGNPIDNILVLSYTNASATDMKLKIVRELSNAIKDENDEIKALLLEQFDNLSFSDICTMDAFLGKLIRENFEKLGVSPKLMQMDELEADELKKRVMSEVISDEYDKRRPDFLNVMNKTTGIVDDTPLQEVVLKLYEAKSIKPHPDDFLNLLKHSVTNDPDSIYGKIIIDYYKDVAKETLDIVEGLLDAFPLEDGSASKIRIVETIENLKNIINVTDSKSVRALQFKETMGLRSKGELISKEDAKFINETKNHVKKNIFDKLQNDLFINDAGYNLDEAEEFIGVVLRVMNEFEEKYRFEKDKNRKLDFNDLSRLALKLLEDEGTAQEVRNKYALVFVDEYQDINPLQEEILQKITKDNLFMVGDIKQSIYAFRNADSKIFVRKKDLYERACGGVALPMTKNFRSNDDILHFVDDVFSSIMTRELGGVNYKNESMFLNSTGESDVKVNIYKLDNEQSNIDVSGVYSVKNHKESMDELEKREYVEGLEVAKTIKELVGSHLKIDGEIREVKFSDIAILFRKRSGGANGFLEALEDAKIPTISDGFIEDAGIKYIKEINALLRAMNNSREDIPFAGYLLSYFGGMTEKDLQYIRTHNAKVPLIESMQDIVINNMALADKCKKTLEFLDECRKRISYLSVSEFLDEIIIDTGFDVYSSAGREGVEGFYAIRAYIQNASKMGDNLESFLDYLDNAGIPEIFAESDGAENAVNILTVHGSKGLEYPIVFLSRADAKWSVQSFDKDIIFDKDLGAGLKIYNERERSKIKSLPYNAINIKHKREEVDENIRLLYVALTRAKCKLYITSCKKGDVERDMNFGISKISANSFLDLILSACSKNSRVRNCVEIADSNVEKPDILDDAKYVFGRSDDDIKAELENIFDFDYKFGDSVKLSPKYSVTMLNRIDNTDEVKVPYIVPKEVDRRRTGIAYHTVLENIDLNLSTTTDVNYFIKNLVEEGVLDENDAENIDGTKILSAINNDIVKSGIKGKYIREKSFMLKISAKELGLSENIDDDIMVQGTLDIAFLGNKPTIIDFKYSTLPDERLANKYRKQLLLYKTALEKAYGYKDVTVMLYSLNSGNFIEIK